MCPSLLALLRASLGFRQDVLADADVLPVMLGRWIWNPPTQRPCTRWTYSTDMCSDGSQEWWRRAA